MISVSIHLAWKTAKISGCKFQLTVEVLTKHLLPIHADTDFQNNTREYRTVDVVGPFTNNTKFRFRCDASANNDWVFIDNVDLSGCTNGSTRIIGESDITTIVQDNSSIESIRTYPNPTNGEFNLEISSLREDNVRVMLVNPQGKIVSKELINASKGLQNIKIDVSDFNPGLYFLHVISEDQKFVEKVLVIQ